MSGFLTSARAHNTKLHLEAKVNHKKTIIRPDFNARKYNIHTVVNVSEVQSFEHVYQYATST